jgi:hypothetical protein
MTAHRAIAHRMSEGSAVSHAPYHDVDSVTSTPSEDGVVGVADPRADRRAEPSAYGQRRPIVDVGGINGERERDRYLAVHLDRGLGEDGSRRVSAGHILDRHGEHGSRGSAMRSRYRTDPVTATTGDRWLGGAATARLFTAGALLTEV